MNRFDVSAIKEFFAGLSKEEKDVVLRCLPLKQEIVEFIQDTEYEQLFWENADYYRSYDVDENILFEKFLKYNPVKLLSPYAYLSKSIDYNKGIALLKAIVRINSEQGFFEDEHYALERLVEEMDSLFFTEELSECEILVLPYLRKTIRDYPLGMKRLFWSNPVRFVSFLKDIYSNKNIFKEGSVGKTIYY